MSNIRASMSKAIATQVLTPSHKKKMQGIQEAMEEQLIGQEDWQKKTYCQICFSKFTRLTLTQHHCRNCGRSCCYYCSAKRPIQDLMDFNGKEGEPGTSMIGDVSIDDLSMDQSLNSTFDRE